MPRAETENVEAKITDALEAARRGGRDSVKYVAPSADELRAFGAWLTTAIDDIDAGAAPKPPPAGWSVEPLGDVLVIREIPSARRGGGAYVLRRAGTKLAVSAPHTFWDAGSLPVAISVFMQARARSLAINTVHRYADLVRRDGLEAGDEDERAESPSDLAHREGTFFQLVHEEMLRRGLPAVQLHGFRDAQVPGADVVFSASGTSADAAPRADALKRSIARSVAAFPRDTKKLGGTTNVQARASVRAGLPFFHVEMSKSTRLDLVESVERRREFASALVAAVSEARTSDR